MERNMKDIMEKVKVTASQAAEAAGRVVDVAGKKAGELMESAKMNMQAFDLNTDIEVLYKEIGKCVYLTHTGVEIDPEEIDAKLCLIDEKFSIIENIRGEIAEKRTIMKCPNCGKECNKNDIFCSACGFELQN